MHDATLPAVPWPMCKAWGMDHAVSPLQQCSEEDKSQGRTLSQLKTVLSAF